MGDDSLPDSYTALGQALQKLRGSVALRPFAKQSGFSKSALHRYEAGAPIPLIFGPGLDELYQADGWVELSINTLGAGSWEPWRNKRSATDHFYRWPARYTGLVWIAVSPVAEEKGRLHGISLAWGPWRFAEQRSLQDVFFYVTGKAPDDISVVLNLRCDKKIVALFGAGTPPAGAAALDIIELWTRAEP